MPVVDPPVTLMESGLKPFTLSPVRSHNHPALNVRNGLILLNRDVLYGVISLSSNLLNMGRWEVLPTVSRSFKAFYGNYGTKHKYGMETNHHD